MSADLAIIVVHQVLFQGMFFTKNILLKRRLNNRIRGWNKEATISITFFVIYIASSMMFAWQEESIGQVSILNTGVVFAVSAVLLLLNLMVSALSLIHLRDSWRVGVIEEQKTDLVTSGIYRFTRNPYFVSYLLMFAAYPILLQNIFLILLSLIGFGLVHLMVLREEDYLLQVHDENYQRYMQVTRRYF